MKFALSLQEAIGMSTVSSSSDTTPANFYHYDMAKLEDQIQSEAKKTRERNDEQIQKVQDHYDEVITKKNEEHEKALNAAKSSSNEALTQERENHRADLEKLKSNLYNNKGQLAGNVSNDVYKKQIQDLYDSSQQRHEKDVQNIEDKDSTNADKLRAIGNKHREEINGLTNQHADETRHLNDEIKTLSNYNHTLGKEKDDEIAKWIQDNEGANRATQQQLSESFDSNIKKLQHERDQKDTYYINRTNEALKQNDEKYSTLFTQQGAENHQNLKEAENRFQSELGEINKGRKQDQLKAEESRNNQLDQAHQEHARALVNQAEQYQNSFGRSKQADRAQIESLEATLQKMKTTQDSSLVSPAIETNIRKNIVNEYEKTLKTEIDKNKNLTDHLQQNNAEAIRKTLNERADKETAIHQQNARDQLFERSQYTNSLQENDDQINTKLRDIDKTHEQEKETLYRQFSNVVDQQKRQYEYSAESNRTDIEGKLLATRQEANFNLKQLQRTLNTKQNELVHDYEKKLSDQKNSYESQIEELKAQSQIDLRESERRMKQELDIQAKNYDQRMIQTEAQTKEHEQLLAQNYQNELDRTKRSYEIINKKKS